MNEPNDGSWSSNGLLEMQLELQLSYSNTIALARFWCSDEETTKLHAELNWIRQNGTEFNMRIVAFKLRVFHWQDNRLGFRGVASVIGILMRMSKNDERKKIIVSMHTDCSQSCDLINPQLCVIHISKWFESEASKQPCREKTTSSSRDFICSLTPKHAVMFLLQNITIKFTYKNQIDFGARRPSARHPPLASPERILLRKTVPNLNSPPFVHHHHPSPKKNHTFWGRRKCSPTIHFCTRLALTLFNDKATRRRISLL